MTELIDRLDFLMSCECDLERAVTIRDARTEIEELRAAICGAFELTPLESKHSDAVLHHRSVWDDTTRATILRVLKEKQKEQRNEH